MYLSTIEFARRQVVCVLSRRWAGERPALAFRFAAVTPSGAAARYAWPMDRETIECSSATSGRCGARSKRQRATAASRTTR